MPHLPSLGYGGADGHQIWGIPDCSTRYISDINECQPSLDSSFSSILPRVGRPYSTQDFWEFRLPVTYQILLFHSSVYHPFIMASTPTYADEKGGIQEIERVDSESSNQARIDAFTPEEQKKIIRKVDLRLIPTLGFMYCVSLMDRTNLGVAMVAGMGVDLKLTGERYSLVVLLFFITYVALQPPATVVLRKLGPRVFLPVIVVIWGTVMIGFGFVKEWHTLLPLRLLLGIFEAGFFPGKLNVHCFLNFNVLTLFRLCLPSQLLVPAI
jgi:hypothetical protein